MNEILLIIGTIILLHFILLTITPSYEEYSKSSKNKKIKISHNKNSYNWALQIICFLISLGINFTIWGLIL